jgi:hypothetical protein
MLRHILYYIPIGEKKSSKQDGRVLSQGTEASHMSEAICGRGSRIEAVYSPLRLFEQRGIQEGERGSPFGKRPSAICQSHFTDL